jgi:hypothetical protein
MTVELRVAAKVEKKADSMVVSMEE